MKKIKGLILLLSFMVMPCVGMAASYDLDSTHSYIGFSVKHLVISNVRGEFTSFSGAFDLDKDDNLSSALIEIDAKTINTRHVKRDNHLKSPDFLDVEKFPKLIFKYKKTKNREGNNYEVIGDLTIHGVTKEVFMDMELLGKVKDPWKNNRLGFTGTTKINRKDFGLVWNKALETGGFVVGDVIRITIEGEGILRK